MVDSACNAICVPSGDPCIVKYLDHDIRTVRHLGGECTARACLVRTPLGLFHALAGPGFQRLLPQFLFARDGHFIWDDRGPRGVYRGNVLDIDLVANIPRLADKDYSKFSPKNNSPSPSSSIAGTTGENHSYLSTISPYTHTNENFSYHAHENDTQKKLKFLLSHDFISEGIDSFLDGKRQICFNENHLHLLNQVMAIQVNGKSLREFLQAHHGYGVSPRLVMRKRQGKMNGPHSTKPHVKLQEAISQCTLVRVSISAESISIGAWHDTHNDDKDTLHIFFAPTANARWGEVEAFDYCYHEDEVDFKAYTVNAAYKSTLDNASQQLAKLIEEDENDERVGTWKTLDHEFCEKHDHDRFDHKCVDCVRAGLRSRQHRRSKGKVKVGKMNVDIALYSKSGPYVLTGVATSAEGATIIVCEPITKRDTGSIKRGLSSLINQFQYRWNCGIISRIMSDRERGVIACTDHMLDSGINMTFTQGADPASNGRAESSVNLVSLAARIRLKDFQEPVKKKLWPAAMVHSANSISYRNSVTKPENFELLPFGARCEVRWPPAQKLGKVVPRTFYGLYLHPSVQTPKGHLVLRLDADEVVREVRIGVTMVAHPEDQSDKNKLVKFARGKHKIPAERHVRNAKEDEQISGTLDKNNNEIDDEPKVRRSERIKNLKQNSNSNKISGNKITDASAFAVDVDEYNQMCSEVQEQVLGRNEVYHASAIDFGDLELVDLPDELIAHVTRLCKREEHFTQKGREATEKELNSVLANEVLGVPVEESDVPVGSEIGSLASILSEKDVETTSPEFKSRIIYLGDRPSVKVGEGKTRKMDKSEEGDMWAASLADHTSVRALLSWSLTRRVKTWSCDLKSAYLQAPSKGKRTFCRLPRTIRDCLPEHLRGIGMRKPLWPLDKALYGRIRSGRDWADLLEGTLQKHGYQRSTSSRGLFFNKSLGVALCVYVDDIIFAGDAVQAKDFFSTLEKSLKLKTNKDGSVYQECSRFLGVEYERKESECANFDELHISMHGYISKMIADYERDRNVQIRARNTLPEEPTPGQGTSDRSRKIVGSLLWLARCMRPDLCRLVNVLASNITKWSPEFEDFERALLGYILQTQDEKLVMKIHKDDSGKDLSFKVHSDANLQAPRSYSGCFSFLESQRGSFLPIGWISRKQALAVTSSAAAEFIALSLSTEHSLPLCDTLTEIGVIARGTVPKVFCDNQAVLLGVGRSFSSYDRTIAKATALRMCQCSDLASLGEVVYSYIDTDSNRADGLTKVLRGGWRYKHARALFGLV